MKHVVAGLLVLALASCTTPHRSEGAMTEIEHLTSPATTSIGLPFSEAVRVGDTLWVSGQIGNLPGELRLVTGGMTAQARQTMENMKAVLERHGSDLAHVVKCTVFLADVSEWAAFNEVYVQYFPTDRLPARSALGANGLALDARLEIECIAVVKP